MIVVLLLGGGEYLAQDQPPSSDRRALDQALAVEKPEERIAALQQFLEAKPESALADTAREEIVRSWAVLAEGQLAEQNIAQALRHFRQALAALPEQVSDRFFEETVARIPLAVSVRGYRMEAIELARELEPRFAEEALRLSALGEFYLSVEAPGEAIRALEAAAQLALEEARVHRALASAYRQGLRLDDAAAELQRAVGLNPKEKQAYYELANLYRAQGALEEAVELYRQQLKIEPKHIPSHKGLALTYLAQGKEDLASAELEQVRALKGSAGEVTQDLHLQTQLAFYYLAQGKISRAQKTAELALTLEPRYSWARIAAAEVDLAEGRYFEAERHLLAALRYANFPTLAFTLGRVYLAVEDFEGALDQFAKAFSYTPSGEFATRLGGALDRRAKGLDDLLARERQASLFVYDPPIAESQFKLAETLVRLDAYLRAPQPAAPRRTGATNRKQPDNEAAPNAGEVSRLEQAARDFIEADSRRRPFRALYAAQRLMQAGQALELAVKLAQQALDLAEAATEAEGSLPDYPNYDREGRLRIFQGRAADAQGWALLKLGRTEEALTALKAAVTAYGALPERKRALWHLAVATETAGDLREAVKLYIAGYEPPDPSSAGSDINRTVIEILYRKVHGSLQGLDEQIGKASRASGGEVATASAPASAPPNAKAREGAEPERDLTKEPELVRSEGEPPTSSAKNVPQLPEINGGKDHSLLLLNPKAAQLKSETAKLGEALLRLKVETPPPAKPTTSSEESAEGSAPGSTRPRRVKTDQPASEPPIHTRKRRVTSSGSARPRRP